MNLSNQIPTDIDKTISDLLSIWKFPTVIKTDKNEFDSM